MNEEKETIGELAKTMWFWLVPLAGGFADWAVQMQRGMKPSKPTGKALCFMGLHLAIAMFFGCLCVFLTSAVGYTDHMALGAAGGIGGHLGVRTMDLFNAIAKAKGVDVK